MKKNYETKFTGSYKEDCISLGLSYKEDCISFVNNK